MACAAIVIISCFTLGAQAQDKPVPEIRFISGWTGFIDESWIHHAAVGGSLRYYLTRRLSLEPEFLYLIGPGSDRDITLIPHVSLDFRPGKPLRPYVIGGAGLHRFTDRPISFTVHTWVVNGGFGVRIPLGSRLFVAPEARIGFETALRFSGSLGFTF